MSEVIITAALTGAMSFKGQNPNVPYTPEEFAEEAYRCWQALRLPRDFFRTQGVLQRLSYANSSSSYHDPA